MSHIDWFLVFVFAIISLRALGLVWSIYHARQLTTQSNNGQ
jgi:cell division protein FtsL